MGSVQPVEAPSHAHSLSGFGAEAGVATPTETRSLIVIPYKLAVSSRFNGRPVGDAEAERRSRTDTHKYMHGQLPFRDQADGTTNIFHRNG